jgi:restriction system protein
VRFVSSTGEIRETHITDKEQRANFDSTCYQICLRTIHELFEADDAKNHDKLLFNGFTTYVDKATGKDVRSCIMSVLVGRDEFLAIDLSRVDPRACFKSLKGVSASTLSALAPIPPVMKMNRSDKRFIEARDTVSGLNNETNLASMSWDDFEHLVRELFEKEFAARGGEVRVTQSSSDGGVDAIAFDPDPISGGKIVIQAKRYTRTVDVSAVRDLYGTLLSEGASKGLLVTTADYGPDAHKFASGKPITLISGSNLLHLLAKHGYQAKIDIREARKELNLRDRD